MAVLQLLIGLALRSLGRIVNTALGWATALLFGRVPQQRQIIVTTMAFGSVVWLIAVAGIAWPHFATFLLTFVTLPPWVNHAWVRLAMLAAAAAIPLIVGAAALFLMEPAYRPRGAANIVRAMLPGYRYTFGIAVTLLVTAIIAPVMQVRTLLRRWTTRHVPVVIRAEDYGDVVRDIGQALGAEGIAARRVPTSPLIGGPTRMLALLIGNTIEGMVARDLTTFAGRGIEVMVHPFDIVVSGHKRRVTEVQAMLTETLPFTRAHLTWTRDANEIEDRLREAWRNHTAGSPGGRPAIPGKALEEIEDIIRHAGVAFEEWETLFREFLLVERRLLRPSHPGEADSGVRRAG